MDVFVTISSIFQKKEGQSYDTEQLEEEEKEGLSDDTEQLEENTSGEDESDAGSRYKEDIDDSDADPNFDFVKLHYIFSL